jgi:hypothetical protein
MKVGFYDSKKYRMVNVEKWEYSLEDARMASIQMATMYQTGKHRMPSPIWCVWQSSEECSIFLLDSKERSEQFLEKVSTALK